MAVHIRLSRAGAKKRPFYRIVVTDQRSPRGTFDPVADDGRFTINLERLTYWRSKGALPSATLDKLLKRQARAAAQPAEPEAK